MNDEPAFIPDIEENKPDWVQMPNRKVRRKLQKEIKKQQIQIMDPITGKYALNSKEFKQDLYRRLLMNMQNKSEYYKEKYKENIDDGKAVDSAKLEVDS